jgi:hypothetical protein
MVQKFLEKLYYLYSTSLFYNNRIIKTRYGVGVNKKGRYENSHIALGFLPARRPFVAARVVVARRSPGTTMKNSIRRALKATRVVIRRWTTGTLVEI